VAVLNVNFLEELLRLAFLKQNILERVLPHLRYQYLPSPELKQIYKTLSDQFTLTGAIPTFGVVFEKHKDDEKLLTTLKRIKECEIVDPDPVLRKLESYIKEVRFQELWEDVVEIHKKGDKEKAIRVMAEKSAEIVEFSIFRDNGNFLKVFGDFQKMQLEKQLRKEQDTVSKEKIPFGILPCDVVSGGGMDRKDTVLWVMRSGVGKSTVLKHQGMIACRLGYSVLHIQLEGSREEVFDKYTQSWSAVTYNQARTGDIEDDKYHHLLSVANEMVSMKYDICVKSFEQFDEASMVDVRDAVIEYIKEFGAPPDELILDSIDLVNPGDGIKYGADTQSIKMKINNSSRKFKNICSEFDMRGVTADQTSDVKIDVWNDPDKVITRSDAMGDKNIANSYSYVFTGNQTMDEEKRKTMRIYFDKIRYYDAKSRVYPIATNFALGRFYDANRTLKLFKDVYPNE